MIICLIVNKKGGKDDSKEWKHEVGEKRQTSKKAKGREKEKDREREQTIVAEKMF